MRVILKIRSALTELRNRVGEATLNASQYVKRVPLTLSIKVKYYLSLLFDFSAPMIIGRAVINSIAHAVFVNDASLTVSVSQSNKKAALHSVSHVQMFARAQFAGDFGVDFIWLVLSTFHAAVIKRINFANDTHTIFSLVPRSIVKAVTDVLSTTTTVSAHVKVEKYVSMSSYAATMMIIILSGLTDMYGRVIYDVNGNSVLTSDSTALGGYQSAYSGEQMNEMLALFYPEN